MTIASHDGARRDSAGRLDAEAVTALRAAVRGPVSVPGEEAYEAARSLWNGAIDRRPAVVLRPLGTADVIAGLAFAREHGLLPTIKGGGHNIAGLAVADGGLLLDMSLMRGVHVDVAARRARVQAGCLLADVDRETQLHGLAACLGFVSTTGVAGLTLGGGFGYLTRRFGWTSDTVRSIDLVLADGRPVRASEHEHPDLFWGLRGGGGNFGVVTSFEYELFPVGPEIVGGAIAWPIDDAPEVLELFRRTMEEAPPELILVAALRKAPPAPWIDATMHGREIVALFVCHSGDPAEGERLVAPIKGHGRPVGDIVGRRSFVSQQSLLDATQPKGRRYYWKSEYLPDHDPAFLAAATEHARRLPSPHSAILIFPLDGAVDALPADHSPVGNRDARSLVNIAASWERPDDDAAAVAWARETWSDLRRFSTGGAYVNFQTEDEGSDRLRDAYGGHLDRLAQVKTRWDPDNLFRSNRNVAPIVGGGAS